MIAKKNTKVENKLNEILTEIKSWQKDIVYLKKKFQISYTETME